MLKRVFSVFSVSLSLIMFVFVIAMLSLAQTKGLVPPVKEMITSPFMLSLIFFEIFMLLGGLTTGLAFKRQNKRLLVIGTIFLAVSSVPSVINGLGAENVVNTYMLTMFSLAPIFINIIHFVMFDLPIANKDIGTSSLKKKGILGK
ncbi:MAG: hypothetical protein RR425_05460 [Erysipelotrichales bacterium]